MDPQVPDQITDVDITKEMQEAYLQYSMSVIVGRALPDVRDGLKPVHRRVLYAMHELSNYHNKPYKKSARVVGDVIGKYHPHGDMAVYDTMVRMAQDFSLRDPLIDGQGNFGSIDGDSPAAQRYTEVRMTKLAEELLTDIDKETVAWQPNYDDSLEIPTVLPAKYPNLLVNGSAGIAVGMATNIPPHNLGEVVEGCLKLIEQPDVRNDELIKIIPGPDFPTSAVISGRKGIHQAYTKGRGIISLKAVAEIIEVKGRDQIIVTEIPYQVNKARLIESIANLVRDKKLEGISDIRDESSREGMRIVIVLKRGEAPQVILNRLYKFTQMQVSFGIIMLALDARNQPRMWNLKDTLEAFIEHRKDVITRRCIFDLKKAEARAHILEGLKIALDQIDAVVQCIRQSKQPDIAKENLIQKFQFSDKQAQAILEMRLQRLTGLEQEKIVNELEETQKHIAWLKKVLSDVGEIYTIIKSELTEIKEKYATPRKTQIIAEEGEFLEEDLVSSEDVIVSITNAGYIKRIAMDEYRVQKRGGKGLKGAGAREEDYVEKIFAANTLTTILCLSDRGKLYWLKVHRIPETKRTSKGKAIANVLNLSSGEKVKAFLPVKEFSDDQFLVMITEKGTVKKTSLSAFKKPRPSGIIALTIELDDNVLGARVCKAGDQIFVSTSGGMSIRFDESDVRAMGRSAKGVRGISLGSKNQVVVGMDVVPKDCDQTVLVVTTNGYGKRTSLEEYRVQGRGGVGIITQKITDRVGEVVSAQMVNDSDQVMVTTDQGQSIRMQCSDISTLGRNTQGVRLMNLKSGERVTGMAIIGEAEEEPQE